ncbi:MAG TPA: HIT domain-containing protein, partial [Chloroflexota bacterium]
MSGCAFCAIVAGSLPAYTVFDDEIVHAFLDHRPLLPGHVLLVPKQHYETLTDLPPASVEPLFMAVRRLARAVETA